MYFNIHLHVQENRGRNRINSNRLNSKSSLEKLDGVRLEELEPRLHECFEAVLEDGNVRLPCDWPSGSGTALELASDALAAQWGEAERVRRGGRDVARIERALEQARGHRRLRRRLRPRRVELHLQVLQQVLPTLQRVHQLLVARTSALQSYRARVSSEKNKASTIKSVESTVRYKEAL